MNLSLPSSPLQKITHPLLVEKSIQCFIKRDDLLHPWLSGNKWRKLKYILKHAKEKNLTTLISFGGAFSNHLYALAGAGKLFGFHTVGIIRGEDDRNNPTIQFLRKMGMECHFVSRLEYRHRHELPYQEKWGKRYPNALIIPEGGRIQEALRGVGEITHELAHIDYDFLCCPVGSATTLAGLSAAIGYDKKVLGFAALKNADYLKKDIQMIHQQAYQQDFSYQLKLTYHGGGFGKISPEIAEFTQQFYQQTNIPIEPIYTGKMLFGLWDMIQNDEIKQGSKIIALHTGGLQGLDGLAYRNKFQLMKSDH